jgi:hypothetical protein
VVEETVHALEGLASYVAIWRLVLLMFVLFIRNNGSCQA